MKRKNQKATLLIFGFVYLCAFMFINLHWSWLPGRLEVQLSPTRQINIVTSERTTWIQTVPRSKEGDFVFTRVKNINGSYKPSFSTGNFSVPVSSLDEYNEFQYQDYRIRAPLFAREYDETFFQKFEPAKDIMDPVAYNRKRGVVHISRNGYYSFPFSCGWPSDYSTMIKPPKGKSAEHFSQLCPLIAPESHTFQHFVDGLVPKIIQIRDVIMHPDMKVLLETPRQSDRKILLELIRRIGIKESQIVWRTGTYYTADYMVETCIAPPLHPALWRTARKLYGAADKLPVPIKDSYIVLLTRALNHNGGRKLINKQEVMTFLEQKYGKKRIVLFKGGYSLDESLDMFGKTRLMIGVHGGALYNLNFASTDSVILELMPSTERGYVGFAHTIFWSMAEMVGQSYWRVFVKSQSSAHNVIFDIETLNNTLAAIHKTTPLE